MEEQLLGSVHSVRPLNFEKARPVPEFELPKILYSIEIHFGHAVPGIQPLSRTRREESFDPASNIDIEMDSMERRSHRGEKAL